MGAAARQTRENRPTINTPFGRQSWVQDAQGNWTLNQTLDPRIQGLFDFGISNLQQPFDWSTAPGAARDRAYGLMTQRLDPQWAQREQQFGAGLANQGLDPGTQAYGRASQTFNQGRNDAYQQAQLASYGIGQQELMNLLAARRAPLEELGGLFGLSGPMFNEPRFNEAGNYLGAAGLQGQYAMDAAQLQEKYLADILSGAFGFGRAAVGGGGGGGG
jgi:hypothetical protein